MQLSKEDMKKNFSENFTQFREAMELSREAMAAKIGVKTARLLAWEQRRALPQSYLWPTICAIIKFDQVPRLLTERIDITMIKYLNLTE